MKRIILLLCICFLTLKSKSQIVAQDHEGLATFLNSTLYVPITGYKEFDEALQSAFKKYWKITPYKMANEAEYSALEKENKKRKGKQSFLFELSYSSFSITRTSYVSTFYQGTEGYDFYDKTKKFNHAKYRIDYVVKLMNDAITLVKNNKLGPAPGNSTLSSPLRDELCKLFSENAKVIKDKTLILNRDMKFLRTEIYDEKIFAKYYPYSYKFVSEDEFNDILKGEQKEYVCFIPSYNLDDEVNKISAYEFVYEPATRSVIYLWFTRGFNKHIKKEDIEQLKKTIGK
ncbi:MAG: hypothetical protein WAQ28_13365 [Bacteroidia bacterium]|jgi:hypothetical protein